MRAPPAPPRSRGGQWWPCGQKQLEHCQSPDPTRISGDLWGPPETWCSQRQLGLFPQKPPPPPPAPAPFPWPRSRGDPELEKTPRQAPRSGAAKRETGKCQGSSKPKCENSVSLRKPRGPVGRLWRGWGWGGRGPLAAGGPAALHSGEHPLHPGLGSHVIVSHVASQATTPQLQQVPVEIGLLSPYYPSVLECIWKLLVSCNSRRKGEAWSFR